MEQGGEQKSFVSDGKNESFGETNFQDFESKSWQMSGQVHQRSEQVTQKELKSSGSKIQRRNSAEREATSSQASGNLVQQHFDQGSQSMMSGDYSLAIQSLKEAFRLMGEILRDADLDKK